jgi:hypothetical protein
MTTVIPRSAGWPYNPFKRTPEGERDVTRISEMIARDPALAKEMCKAAGEPLAAWFPENPQ